MKSSPTFSILNKKIRGRPLPLFVALSLLSGALSLCCGAASVPLRAVVSALTGKFSGAEAQIVLYARLPRTLAGLLAGAALAVAGAVIQTALQNPLAGPNIIGVNTGAGFGVALCAALFPAALWLIPLGAFLGALTGTFLVLFIARRGGASRLTLLLSGVAVSSVFSALIDAIVSFYPAALSGYSDFRIGGLGHISPTSLRYAACLILPALLLCCLLHRELDILALGSDTAQSLGLRPGLVRALALSLAAALVGATVSFSGLIGFVGLLVPHALRKMLGEECGKLLPCCAFGGAAFLTFCDTLARTLFAPYELSVGIILSLLGGPFFLMLLLRQRKGRSHA